MGAARGETMTAIAQQDRFLALVEEHEKILFKVASSYCRNPEDRRDLIQEIVAQLWRSFGGFDDRYRFSTWMYRIAMNVAISFYRSQSRRTRGTVPIEESGLDLVAAAPEPGDVSDDIRLLHQFIGQLDELNRGAHHPLSGRKQLRHDRRDPRHFDHERRHEDQPDQREAPARLRRRLK